MSPPPPPSFMHEAVPHRSKRVRVSHEPNSSTSPSAVTSIANPLPPPQNTHTPTAEESDTSSILSTSSSDPSSDETSSEEEEEEEEEDDASSSNGDTSTTQPPLNDPNPTDAIINLRANRGKKPIMKLSEINVGPDIRVFLKDFLPQLKAANEELMAQKRAGTLRALDEDEEQDREDGAAYIEMDLGLGVLEEKDPDSKSDVDMEMEDVGADADKEGDVLGKLLGREKKMDAVGIEEVPDTTGS